METSGSGGKELDKYNKNFQPSATHFFTETSPMANVSKVFDFVDQHNLSESVKVEVEKDKFAGKKTQNYTNFVTSMPGRFGQISEVHDVSHKTVRVEGFFGKNHKSCAAMKNLLSQPITINASFNSARTLFIKHKVYVNFGINLTLKAWRNVEVKWSLKYCEMSKTILCVLKSVLLRVTGLVKFKSSPNFNKSVRNVEITFLADISFGLKNKSQQIAFLYQTMILPRLHEKGIKATEKFKVWGNDIGKYFFYKACSLIRKVAFLLQYSRIYLL